MVGFDQLVGLLLADLRLLGVVLVDHFDRLSRHLPAELIEGKIEPIAHIVADGRRRTTERTDKADLDRVGRLRRRSGNSGRYTAHDHGASREPGSRFTHVSSHRGGAALTVWRSRRSAQTMGERAMSVNAARAPGSTRPAELRTSRSVARC
jgi:hypothetical protein